MKFNSAQEILEFIQSGNDLYSPSMETYVFVYNEAGSICSYDIDQEEAKELAKMVAESDEKYWGAFLGWGGLIYDDPSHELYEEGDISNLDYCEELIEAEDWIVV